MHEILFKIKNKIKRVLRASICIQKRNASIPLNIRTYDGGNECLHPSCLYFADGWPADSYKKLIGGGKFWLVVTPYKDMNDAIENPCIYRSDDGERFEPVEGANPLDDIKLDKAMEYNSDPELVFNPEHNRLECWWRRVQRNDYPTEEGKNREIIYRRYTTDGQHWSEREEMLNVKNPFPETRMAISPALLYEDGIYKMWVSSADDFEGRHRTINYYEMRDGEPMHLVCKHVLRHGIISHLDVIHAEGRYWLIGNDVRTDGFPLKLYSFQSPTDEEYRYEGVVLSKGKRGHWDDRVIYRPSVTRVGSDYWLYYSAYGSNPMTSNHVGLVRFHSWKELLRCFLQ